MSSSNGFWWWSSASGGASADFDRLLENCTSSNLPSSTPPPITHSLTLSDLIRSSAVSPSNAVKSLQKRLNHPNPNVQLLVISVIDVCVKNGGDGFIRQISAREFSEDCAQIISNPISNTEVKEKLKREFQNWALAFEAVPFLASSELVINYRRLKTLGIEFPPKDPLATAAMVDSMSAPEWKDSDVCDRCRTAFSFTNRKHHCRNCGGVFDGQCSGKKRALPHFGVTESVRICDGCDRSLAAGITDPTKTGRISARRNSFSGESSYPSPAKLSLGQNNHHRSATIHSGASTRATHRYTSSTPAPHHSIGNALSREEADLERAIALSLQESNSSQRASFPRADSAPGHQSYISAPSKSQAPAAVDSAADPDLAAAIAASLRDAQLSSNPHPSAPMPVSPAMSLETLPSRPSVRPQSANEEHINILLNFSADVDTASRLGQLVPTNAELNNRHAQAEAARLDLNRGIDNAERKSRTLREMNDKLSQAVKLYDRLLRDQIQYRTGITESSGTSAPGYPAYGTALPFQPDNHYPTNSNQAFAPHINQASFHHAQNSATPYAVHAVPVGHNFPSAPPHMIAQAETNNTAYSVQPNHHLNSFNHASYQYSRPAPAQPVQPVHRNAPSISQQYQSPYPQEYSGVGLSQPVASNPSLSPAPSSPYPEGVPSTNLASYHQQQFNNSTSDFIPVHGPSPSNALANSPGSGNQFPMATSQSPVTFTATPTVHLTDHNQPEGQHPNQILPHQLLQPSSFTNPDPNSPSASQPQHSHDSSFQSVPHQSSQPPPPHQMGSIDPSSLNQDKHVGQESQSAADFLASSAALQTTNQSSSSNTITHFPSFPNVPNTQLAWSSNPSPGAYPHHTGIDVPPVRQEEVAPLIEL